MARISILSRKGDFESLFPILLQKGYECSHFESAEEAVTNPELFDSKVVIIDIPQNQDEYWKLFSTLKHGNPQSRIITAWEPGEHLSSGYLLSIFKVLRKPVSAHVLTETIDEAIISTKPYEARKEERAPVRLPIEVKKGKQWEMMRTSNMSIHGMQAVWRNKWGFQEARRIHEADCRVYLDEYLQNYISVPVQLRYAAFKDANKAALLGFEFGSIGFDHQVRLYQSICENAF